LVAVARDLTVRLAADRPGELASVIDAVSRSGVNIEAVTEVEGLVHVLARDAGAVRAALRGAGYTIEGEREVIIMPMSDRPGELAMTLRLLADAQVNVRFVYLATATRVVIGAEDVMKAREALGPSAG
jgi:hypothetical protein